jgi:hypothetical protein
MSWLSTFIAPEQSTALTPESPLEPPLLCTLALSPEQSTAHIPVSPLKPSLLRTLALSPEQSTALTQ